MLNDLEPSLGCYLVTHQNDDLFGKFKIRMGSTAATDASSLKIQQHVQDSLGNKKISPKTTKRQRRCSPCHSLSSGGELKAGPESSLVHLGPSCSLPPQALWSAVPRLAHSSSLVCEHAHLRVLRCHHSEASAPAQSNPEKFYPASPSYKLVYPKMLPW